MIDISIIKNPNFEMEVTRTEANKRLHYHFPESTLRKTYTKISQYVIFIFDHINEFGEKGNDRFCRNTETENLKSVVLFIPSLSESSQTMEKELKL